MYHTVHYVSLMSEISGGGFFLKKCEPQGIVTRHTPDVAEELLWCVPSPIHEAVKISTK